MNEPQWNGKLALLQYGPCTPPAVTVAHCNQLLGQEYSWHQEHAWELGDGDPGIVVPDGVDADDPRVLAMLSKLEQVIANADDEQDWVGLDDHTMYMETDDAVLLYVHDDGGDLFPELHEDYEN